MGFYDITYFSFKEKDIGVCSIAVLANFSCTISMNLERCILQTCVTRFRGFLVDDSQNRSTSFLNSFSCFVVFYFGNKLKHGVKSNEFKKFLLIHNLI